MGVKIPPRWVCQPAGREVYTAMGHMSTPVGWGVSTESMKIVIKDFNLSFRSSGEVSAQLAATLADQMKIGVLKKMGGIKGGTL